MSGVPQRSPEEAQAFLDEELAHLAPRRSDLGEAGTLAVAAWAMTHAFEHEAAELAWSALLRLEPRSLEATFQRGLALLEVGRFEAAAEAFRASIELDRELRADPDAEQVDWIEDDPLFRLGNCHHALGDLDAAVAAYERSAARNTVATDALREMARCELARGRPDAALAALDRAAPRVYRRAVRADLEALRADAMRLRATQGA